MKGRGKKERTLIGGDLRQEDGAHLGAILGEVDVNPVDADRPVAIVARRLELHEQTDAARELRHFVGADRVETLIVEGAGNKEAVNHNRNRLLASAARIP